MSFSRTEEITSKAVFMKLMSPFLEVLANKINKNRVIHGDEKPKKKIREFSVEIITKFCGLLLKQCVTPSLNLEKAFREDSPISRYACENIRQFLPDDWSDLFGILQINFIKNWKISGTLALDEMVWGWTGENVSVVYLPGKPHEWGIKVFAICILSTRTQYPYCYWFQPDLHKNISQTEILDCTNRVLGPKVSFTADRWFGSLAWMNTHSNVLTTMALKKNQCEHLFDLFGNGLRKGEYRVFSNGKVLICVWASESIVKTATTCFSIQEENQTNLSEVQNHQDFTFEGAVTLKKLCRNDLQILCTKLGLAICN